MGELIIALLAVLSAFLLHLAVWKIRLPRRQTRAILLIFFATLAAAVTLLPSIARAFPFLGIAPPLPLAGYLHIAIFHVACTLAYMITYSAIEVDSPSLVMTMAIRRAGAAGLPEAEFSALMNDDLLVAPRLRDMERDGLVTRTGDSYHLTPKGRRLARMFTLHRSLLGLGKGG